MHELSLYEGLTVLYLYNLEQKTSDVQMFYQLIAFFVSENDEIPLLILSIVANPIFIFRIDYILFVKVFCGFRCKLVKPESRVNHWLCNQKIPHNSLHTTPSPGIDRNCSRGAFCACA